MFQTTTQKYGYGNIEQQENPYSVGSNPIRGTNWFSHFSLAKKCLEFFFMSNLHTKRHDNYTGRGVTVQHTALGTQRSSSTLTSCTNCQLIHKIPLFKMRYSARMPLWQSRLTVGYKPHKLMMMVQLHPLQPHSEILS